jgi:hypothetical protein
VSKLCKDDRIITELNENIHPISAEIRSVLQRSFIVSMCRDGLFTNSKDILILQTYCISSLIIVTLSAIRIHHHPTPDSCFDEDRSKVFVIQNYNIFIEIWVGFRVVRTLWRKEKSLAFTEN